jgi:thioesterase domain-containing protein
MSTLHTDLSTEPAAPPRPLNPYAHRFWQSQQWQPHQNKHNLSICFTIEGALDTQQLQAACQHYAEQVQPEILGTVQLLNHQPHCVPGRGAIDWQTVAYSQLTSAASTPFVLDQAPLHRFRLARQSATKHVLLITLPHFLADKTTAHIIASSIGQYYRQPNTIHATTASPAHPAVMDTNTTDNPASVIIDLPIAPTPSCDSAWATPHHEVLDRATTQRLKQHAKTLGTTPFVVLMSCWGWLLGRLAHQQTVVLHYPTDARPASHQPQPGCWTVHRSVTLMNDTTPDALCCQTHAACKQQIRPVHTPAHHLCSQSILAHLPLDLGQALRCQWHHLAELPRIAETWLAVDIADTVHLQLCLNESAYGTTHAKQWLSILIDLIHAVIEQRFASFNGCFGTTEQHQHHQYQQLRHLSRTVGVALAQCHRMAAGHYSISSCNGDPTIDQQNAMQKNLPQDWHVEWPVEQHPAPLAHESVASIECYDDTEYRLLQLWQSCLGTRKPIGRQQRFEDLGGHSLQAIQLIERMSSVFQHSVTLHWLQQHNTIASQAQQLQQQPLDDITVMRHQPHHANSTTWVLIHPGMAGCEVYQHLVPLLPSEDSVIAINNPHLRASSRPHLSIEAMADAYLQKVQNISADRVVLVGWSLGGVIAHHMACLDANACQAVHMLDAHALTAQQLRWTAWCFHSTWFDRLVPGLRGDHLKQQSPHYRARLLACAQHEIKIFKQHQYGSCAVPCVLYKATHCQHWGFRSYTRSFDNAWYAHCERLHIHPVAFDHFNMTSAAAMNTIAPLIMEQQQAQTQYACGAKGLCYDD